MATNSAPTTAAPSQKQQTPATSPARSGPTAPGVAAAGKMPYQQGAEYVRPDGGAAGQKPGAPGANVCAAPKPKAGGGSSGAWGGLTGAIGGMEASCEAGSFVEAELKVDIPIPEVPGLNVSVGGKGKYYYSGDPKDKKLKLSASIGAKYKLLSLVEAEGKLETELELRGEDLGAAAIDAVKQTVYKMLGDKGAIAELEDWYRLAQQGPGLKDGLKTLLPVYGTYESGKILAAMTNRDAIVRNHDALLHFFDNNEKVGFTVSIGAAVGAKVGSKDKNAGVELSARAGIDDKDNKKAEAFTEVAGKLSGQWGASSVEIEASKKMQGGKKTVGLSLSGELDVGEYLSKGGKPANLVRDAKLIAACQGTATAIGANSGGKIVEIGQLAGAVGDMATRMGSGLGEHGSHTLGLELSFEWEDGKFKSVEAKVEDAVGVSTAKAIPGVEASFKVGSFVSVSGEFAAALGAGKG